MAQVAAKRGKVPMDSDPVFRVRVLGPLKTERLTAKQLGLSAYLANRFVVQGAIVPDFVKVPGEKGRPKKVFDLTANGKRELARLLRAENTKRALAELEKERTKATAKAKRVAAPKREKRSKSQQALAA